MTGAGPFFEPLALANHHDGAGGGEPSGDQQSPGGLLLGARHNEGRRQSMAEAALKQAEPKAVVG